MAFKKPYFILNQKGQSSVEYILLLVVIVSIVNTVFQSNLFKGIFGENGKFARTFKAETEFSYRHTLRGREIYSKPNYNGTHKSYIKQGNQSRFFGALERYPSQ